MHDVAPRPAFVRGRPFAAATRLKPAGHPKLQALAGSGVE
jgi:hypothetical protein